MKYKSSSKNQETIEKLTSEEQLSSLLLIKFNQMKNIQGRIPVKYYQTYLVNNKNIELKYMILQLYDEFQLVMIQTEMNPDYAYF